MKKIKKATGIPRSFLKIVEDQESNVEDSSILMTGGGFAKIVSNEGEFEKRYGDSTMNSNVKFTDIPENLTCPLCNNLLTKALSISCCSSTFCDSCITKCLLEETNFHCPTCKSDAKLDNLTPNQKKRDEVESYKNNFAKEKEKIPIENKINISLISDKISQNESQKKDSTVKTFEKRKRSNSPKERKYSPNVSRDKHRSRYSKSPPPRKRSPSPTRKRYERRDSRSPTKYRERSPDRKRGYRRDSKSPPREKYRSRSPTKYRERSPERSHHKSRSDSRERDYGKKFYSREYKK
jgi:hypothetical protein